MTPCVEFLVVFEYAPVCDEPHVMSFRDDLNYTGDGGSFLFGFGGGEFFPESDNSYVHVVLNFPAGTTLEQTDALVTEVEAIVRREAPEIESILATVGGESKGVEDGDLVIRLTPVGERDRDIFEIMNRLRE